MVESTLSSVQRIAGTVMIRESKGADNG